MAQSLDWASMLNMGLTAAGVVAAGIGLGWLVDAFAGTFPIFVLVGVLVGVAGATAYMISKFRTYLKNPHT